MTLQKSLRTLVPEIENYIIAIKNPILGLLTFRKDYMTSTAIFSRLKILMPTQNRPLKLNILERH